MLHFRVLQHQNRLRESMADKSFQIEPRLRSLTEELRALERELKSGAISDLAALQDFRQAIDESRMTAWTASELHNAQPGRKELLASFLAAERIRRYSQMLRDLSVDLEHQSVNWESGGIQTLFDSVTMLQSRLERLIRDHRANFRNLKDDQR
jgi:hypothetical protein